MEAEEDSKHWGKTVKGQYKLLQSLDVRPCVHHTPLKEKMEIIISGNKTEYGPTKKPDS